MSVLNDLPKIAFFDVETSHLEGRFFNSRMDYFPSKNITKDWFMICAAWCDMDSDRVHSVSTLDDPKRLKKNPRDDYFVVKTLRDALSKYDVVIGHNSNAFDLKKLATRCAMLGLPPLPPIKSIDTYKEAKKIGFTSCSLDYLAKMFGIESKPHTGEELWIGSENGDPTSIRKLTSYCKHDVNPMLKQVYFKLKPYITNNPVEKFSKKPECPKCGMNSLIKRGKSILVNGKTVQIWQCRACYKYSNL